MSSIAITDVDAITVLDRMAMADIAGGMDVKIDNVSSTIQRADDHSVLSPGTLAALVNIVIDSLHR